MGGIFGKTKKTAPSRITDHDKVILVSMIDPSVSHYGEFRDNRDHLLIVRNIIVVFGGPSSK